MTNEAFEAYAARIACVAQAHPQILGAALVGSGADPDRADEWSDHDVIVVARPDAVEPLRKSADWLPDANELVALEREWHDGFVGIFRDGRAIEFAVVDLNALAEFPLHAARILHDEGGLSAAIERAASATPARQRSRAEVVAVSFLFHILIGVGRARRGELVSAGDVIRSEAVESFLDLVFAVRYPDRPSPDHFDPRRRFEQVDPTLARELATATAQSVEDAARSLLTLAERTFSGWASWPRVAAAVVRSRYGWDETDPVTHREGLEAAV
ncbi:MAG: hypothetical protein BGO47_13605 [Microbacterium sp. 67-17]|uniref:hypothetical protein n=1 Tax=Microbacterium sp. 67-17 TaxID=1895782 RepID=UPI000963C522|nr:hypothetical protein [Microbacterium sp. 67-17]OJW01487.1 MAG: hypothetical protein BGO47_13605 [Microbacterium sp. 67-17]